MKPVELSAEELICHCLVDDIPDPPKKEAEDEPTPPGQKRGMEAIAFGLSLKKRGFNITVTGAPGSGKTSTALSVVRRKAITEPTGMDICFHQNFTNPDRPGVLHLPPGSGSRLNHLIDELLSLLDKQIPRLLEQPSIKAQAQSIQATYDEQEKALSREAENLADEQGIVIQTTQQGMNLIPLSDGKPMKEEAFLSLTPAQREEIEARRKKVL